MRIAPRADGTTRIVITSADGTRMTTIVEADGTTRNVTGTAAREFHPYRLYRGRTSQALQMFVATSKVASGLRLQQLVVEETLTCEDGTELDWFPGFPFTHDVALVPARLDFDLAWPYEAFHVHGRLGTHMGSGTASDAVPRLTADEQAQLCSAGDLTWRVWRIDEGARPIVP
jgi:hypothetical protein